MNLGKKNISFKEGEEIEIEILEDDGLSSAVIARFYEIQHKKIWLEAPARTASQDALKTNAPIKAILRKDNFVGKFSGKILAVERESKPLLFAIAIPGKVIWEEIDPFYFKLKEQPCAKITIPVEGKIEDENFSGAFTEIGLNGGFMITSLPLEEDSLVLLNIAFPQNPISAWGRVLRTVKLDKTKKWEIAIFFEKLTPETRDEILSLLNV